jgi:uncharacterized protein YwgA
MANDNLIRDVVLLAYKAFDGTIRGKTLLQKRVYFLSIFLRFDLGYEAHYYGPYSEGVATANAELKSMGFLSESATGWGVDRRGFEMARYDFALTDAGSRLAEKKALLNQELWERVAKAANVVKDAGNLDYMELSIAAKAYYVLMHLKRKATLNDISEMPPKFGWSVNKEELTNATRFLEKTGLVKKA